MTAAVIPFPAALAQAARLRHALRMVAVGDTVRDCHDGAAGHVWRIFDDDCNPPYAHVWVQGVMRAVELAHLIRLHPATPLTALPPPGGNPDGDAA